MIGILEVKKVCQIAGLYASRSNKKQTNNPTRKGKRQQKTKRGGKRGWTDREKSRTGWEEIGEQLCER